MEYRKLGTTDIDVSVICLGTMTWGEQNTEAQAHEQLDYALDQGVNFIDTAEMYPVPPIAETYGKTEAFIGTWDKLKTHRDKIILGTKVTGPGMGEYMREGQRALDRKNIEAAIDTSLKRLNVDYIDLYQLHWPNRHTNFFGQLAFTPPSSKEAFIHPEETLEVLADLKKSGKVREFGLSNETPWGLSTFLKLAETKGLPRMQSVQNPYGLLNRAYEVGMAEMSFREKCGLLAYSPLGFGVLSGKYLGGQKPANSRLTLFDRFTRYTNPRALSATEFYVGLAKEAGLDPAQMALAFVNSRPFLTSTIIGATTMEQLKTNIGSIDVTLSKDVLERIEEFHNVNPNPAP